MHDDKPNNKPRRRPAEKHRPANARSTRIHQRETRNPQTGTYKI